MQVQLAATTFGAGTVHGGLGLEGGLRLLLDALHGQLAASPRRVYGRLRLMFGSARAIPAGLVIAILQPDQHSAGFNRLVVFDLHRCHIARHARTQCNPIGADVGVVGTFQVAPGGEPVASERQ